MIYIVLMERVLFIIDVGFKRKAENFSPTGKTRLIYAQMCYLIF